MGVSSKEISDVINFNVSFNRIIKEIDTKKYWTASCKGHLFEFYISPYKSQFANYIVFLNEISNKKNEHSYLNIFKTFHIGYFKISFDENKFPVLLDIAPNISSSFGIQTENPNAVNIVNMFEEMDKIKLLTTAKKIIESKQEITDFTFSPKIKDIGFLDLYIRAYYKIENGIETLFCVTLSFADMNILASKVYNLETNFNDLFSNNLDAVFIFDNRKILTYNKAAEIIAHKHNINLLDYLNFSNVLKIDEEEISNLLLTKDRFEYEIELFKDKKIYIEASIIPVFYNNKNCKAVIVKDLTEQKRLLDDLKNVNSALKRFISIVSHDLRTPFIQLKSLSDIISDNYESFEEDELMKYVDMLDKSTMNGLKLLDNLIEWSKIIINKTTFQPVSFNISELIEETINFVRSNAEAKNINIIFNTSDAKVYADKNMISTVILNLLSNAVKFTNRNGKIEINASENKEDTLICIKDNGVGMSQDTLNHIFAIDNYVSSKGTEGEAGTGLGLLLVNELTKKNNGKVWIDSTIDVGTKFCISLPKEKKETL